VFFSTAILDSRFGGSVRATRVVIALGSVLLGDILSVCQS